MQVEKQDVCEAINNAVSQTLEELAFAEVNVCGPDESFALTDEWLWSSIEIKMPMEGLLTLCMPVDIVREVRDNIFGPPDEDETEEPEDEAVADAEGYIDNALWDTLGELVNTIGDRVMKNVTPADESFDLGLPLLGRGFPHIGDAFACIFELNDRNFVLAYKLE